MQNISYPEFIELLSETQFELLNEQEQEAKKQAFTFFFDETDNHNEAMKAHLSEIKFKKEYRSIKTMRDYVVGIGIGARLYQNQLTEESSVRIYTQDASKMKWIPESFNGLATSIIDINKIKLQHRVRPINPGASVAHINVTSGTLGCFVEDGNGEVYILSNNHVLADLNRAQSGDNILQPGPYYQGVNPKDTVASLYNFKAINHQEMNDIDAAIAKVSPSININTNIPQLGRINTKNGKIENKVKVRKVGKTTGLTTGIIEDKSFTFKLHLTQKNKNLTVFSNQIVITSTNYLPFSDKGDSGSLIVNEENQPIGLLFAGDGQRTYANPINIVLNYFNVKIKV